MGVLVDMPAAVFSGLLLPESFMRSDFFAILAAFVAINTVMYAALAMAKILPKIHLSDRFTSRNRRSESRGIHPEVSG